MAEPAAFLGLDRSTISRLIDRAERRDLFRRNNTREDGRAVQVSLTPAAEQVAAQLIGEISAALGPMIGRLRPSDGRRLTGLLESLLGAPSEE